MISEFKSATLHYKGEVEQKNTASGKVFTTQTVVIKETLYSEYSGETVNYIKAEATGPQCIEALASLNEGDEVTGLCSLKGFEYTSRATGNTDWFTKVALLRIAAVGAAPNTSPAPRRPLPTPANPPKEQYRKSPDDDLPFDI